MAMTQMRSSPSASRQRRHTANVKQTNNNSQKRQLVHSHNLQHNQDEEDIASVPMSSWKAAADKLAPSTSSSASTIRRNTSILSQPPYPGCGTKSSVTCSAIGAFLQHLKQITSSESIEIVSDNPCGTCGKPEPVTGASPKQGRPYNKMTPAQKKNVRWDTHSSTFKAAAASAAHFTTTDTSLQESQLHPLGGLEGAASRGASPQLRSGAGAPTCPRRRTSKEDFSVEDDDDGEGTQGYGKELKNLREQIAKEEALLRSVASAASTGEAGDNSNNTNGDKTASPQKPERRSSLPHLDHLRLHSGILLEDLREEDDEIVSLNDRSRLPSPAKSHELCLHQTTLSNSMGRLPDYKMALRAVAQRYASGPRTKLGSLSKFRSSSLGMLPSAAVSSRGNFRSNSDRPLGIPRRRESADVLTFEALEEASLLSKSPRGTVT